MDQPLHKNRLRPPGLTPRSGFSLIEIAVIMTLLLIAIGGLSSAVVSSVKLSRTNEETAIADDAARQVIAEMKTVGTYLDIFSTYNAEPGDDLGIAGSAPGPNFEVPGLTPWRDDADGLVGEIRFPTQPLGPPGVLWENSDDDSLGMPRDLNGDGDTDDFLQTGYIVLPVVVRLQWRGSAGRSFIEMRAILTE